MPSAISALRGGGTPIDDARSKANRRRGVAFRVGARTRVDADETLQIWCSDRRDARGWRYVQHAEIGTTPWNLPHLMGAAAGHVFSTDAR
jgi:hypothetical protein